MEDYRKGKGEVVAFLAMLDIQREANDDKSGSAGLRDGLVEDRERKIGG